MLERPIVDVGGIAMGDRVQEGRDLPSNIVEVIPPVDTVMLAVKLDGVDHKIV